MKTSIAEKLRDTVDQAATRLLAISDSEAGRALVGKWSNKEILGHLIDSAANNHARFVRAQGSSDLMFEGYDQDQWVRVQRYRERRWDDLVRLWQLCNHHIASVIDATDEATRLRPRRRHTLDTIAFKAVPAAEPTTLDYLMRDYVDHLEHHLNQMFR